MTYKEAICESIWNKHGLHNHSAKEALHEAYSEGNQKAQDRGIRLAEAIRKAGPAFPAYSLATEYLKEVGALIEWEPKSGKINDP